MYGYKLVFYGDFFFNFHPILMQLFTKCSSLWVIDGQDIFLLFYFKKEYKREPNPEISHIWKVHRIFICHPILMCLFLADEWNVLGTFGSMPPDFLYLSCDFWDKLDWKSPQKGANFQRFKVFIFHSILIQFLRSVNQWVIDIPSNMLFYFEKGSNRDPNYEWSAVNCCW